MVAKIGGETNESFMEWLSRSIICTSSVSWDLEDLSQALAKVGCSRVRALTSSKFILTYQSSGQRDEALMNKDVLGNWFHEVKSWDIYEASESRRLWIEVVGVPPHGWSLKNFGSIASLWEKLICLESPIDDTVSFDSMRILIETGSLRDARGHVILQIGDAGYRIRVKEASFSFNINPMFIAPESSTPITANVLKEDSRQPVSHNEDAAFKDDANMMVSANSKGVLPDASSRTTARFSIHGTRGLVNLGNELALDADVERSYWRADANLENEQTRVEGKESTGIQNDSNSCKDDDRLIISLVLTVTLTQGLQQSVLVRRAFPRKTLNPLINLTQLMAVLEMSSRLLRTLKLLIEWATLMTAS